MAHRIGVIGLGVMGQRMLGNIARHPALEVTLAWDPSPAAIERLRAEYPAIAVATGPEALCAGEIDGVYIASPPASHLAHAALAFDHGKPVFCEKPLSTDAAAAAALVARIERKGLRSAVNFPHASAPAFAAVTEALETGALGALRGVDLEIAFAAWPRPWQAAAAAWLAERAEGGFVREVLSHFVFLTQRALGPIAIDAVRIDYPDDGVGAETAIDARLTAGGVPVHIHGGVGGAAADFNAWTLEGGDGAWRILNWYSLQRRLGAGEWADVAFDTCDIRQVSYLRQLDSLDAFLSGRAHPLPDFAEALAVQTTIEVLLAGGARDRDSAD